MRHVLALSLGPVQEFIAAARKARDLSYGSLLLSQMARAVARSLQEQGAELIFPSPDALADEKSGIANKIVAIVPNGLEPAEVAAKANADANASLRREAQAALSRTERDSIHSGDFHAQIERFLEFYAAWAEIEVGEQGYEAARQCADRRLAGRKALRDFGPANGADLRPKSSLDGGRDTVLVEGKRAHSRIKAGEQLDAISLVKRIGPKEDKPFPSASRVAADPFIRHLACVEPATLGRLREMAEGMDRDDTAYLPPDKFPQFAAFPFDMQLFHLETPDNEMDKEAATAFIEQVAAIRKGLKIGEIIPYFATLVADGDKMGRAIGTLETPDAHRRLSQTLNTFAQAAGKIVQKHNGALIYAGGDDVLAFLPLDSAVACADRLRRNFTEALQTVAPGKTPTLSVGLSIAHCRAPLDGLVRWGREAEKLAKTKRNALAVTFRPRSSGDTELSVCDSWEKDPAEQWAEITGLLTSGTLSQGGAYTLKSLARELEGITDEAVFTAEIKRVLERRRRADSNDKLSADDVESLLKRAGTNAEEATAFVNRVLIARPLADAAKLRQETTR